MSVNLVRHAPSSPLHSRLSPDPLPLLSVASGLPSRVSLVLTHTHRRLVHVQRRFHVAPLHVHRGEGVQRARKRPVQRRRVL